jgi:hypothetical protein
VGSHPFLSNSSDCPLRSIVIGSPVFPTVDQLLGPGETAPNLIELPNLPSNMQSPSKGNSGFVSNFSSKYAPKGISVSPSCTCLTSPPVDFK